MPIIFSPPQPINTVEAKKKGKEKPGGEREGKNNHNHGQNVVEERLLVIEALLAPLSFSCSSFTKVPNSKMLGWGVKLRTAVIASIPS